jgi:hypothetical protein
LKKMKAGGRPQYYRIRRLVQMVRESAETGYLPNSSDFMKEFEVSRRTVARDLDFLRDEERAPLEYDDARHGFRLSDETYTLPPVRISRKAAPDRQPDQEQGRKTRPVPVPGVHVSTQEDRMVGKVPDATQATDQGIDRSELGRVDGLPTPKALGISSGVDGVLRALGILQPVAGPRRMDSPPRAHVLLETVAPLPQAGG